MKIWIVTTCIPERGEGPCLPFPFATEAAAEAYADKMMRDEWASHGPESERTGKRKRYPGDWREAQDIIAESFPDGSWGTWQVTCHEVPNPVRDAAPAPATGPYHGPSLADQLRLIGSLAGTDDHLGHQDQRDAVAYVEAVTVDALSALHLAIERLEISNCEGEEDDALTTLRAAIAKAEGRANG